MASVMVLIAIGLLSLLIVIPILLIIDSCQPQLQAGLSFEDVAARLGFPASLTGFNNAGGYAGGDAKYAEVIEVDPEAQLPPSPTTPPVHYRSPVVQSQRGLLPTHQAPTTMMQQQKPKQLFSLPPPLPPKSSLAAMVEGKQPPTGPRPASRLANTPAKGPSDAQRKAAVLSMAKLIMLRHDKACRRQPRPRAPSPSQGHGRARSMPALAITAVTVNDSRAPPVLVA